MKKVHLNERDRLGVYIFLLIYPNEKIYLGVIDYSLSISNQLFKNDLKEYWNKAFKDVAEHNNIQVKLTVNKQKIY